MPSTLTITDLDVAFGARTLFTGLDLTLADGDVTAVVGPNGSGKSTLMRTIVGELPIESGSIRLAPATRRSPGCRRSCPDPAETLLAYARRRTGVDAADRELESASAALASGVYAAERGPLRRRPRAVAGARSGRPRRAPPRGRRDGGSRRRPGPGRSARLSGGQAARASLVAVLLSHYDVLLLDEPTNNLDARGLELMADFVQSHTGPVLIASHDRAFLDAVTTSVVELDLHQQRIGHYTGSYSDFVAQRARRRAQAWEAYEGYAGERDSLVATGTPAP